MRRTWIFVAASLGITGFIWIGGEVVMHLWNWNLPALFGWRQITFWQALGLFALCRILFGDLGMRVRGSHRSDSRWRIRKRVSERLSERLAERWEQMTPEEREKFSRGMRSGGDGQTTPLDSTPRA